MGSLLIQDQPLLVSKKLAVYIGLNEALFLQQLHYWISKSEHEVGGHTWVYNTYEAWQEQFPFWSISTIRRIVSSLKNKGLILVSNFNKKRSDATKWYAINYENIEALEKESFCMPKDSNLNHSSVQNEQTNCSNRTDEVVKMDNSIPKNASKNTLENSSEIFKKEEDEECARPYQFFEENGFGKIGSYLANKIALWCKKLNDDLVVKAMELALEHGCKHWKYIEAVLKDFLKKGYQTRQDVETAQMAFKKQKQTRSEYEDELIKKLQNGYDPCKLPPKKEIDVEQVRRELEKELQKYKKVS